MLQFLKNAFFRGLVILIPLVIIYVTLRELLQLMVAFATPIADLFPEGTFEHAKETELIAILLIVGTALVLGTLAYAKPLRIAMGWLERNTLGHLPMYRMLQSFVAAFLGMENERSFKPGLLSNSDGSRTPVYVVEDRGYGHVTVMQPWSPTAFAGALSIVPSERVELMDVSLDEWSLFVTHFGLGLTDFVEKNAKR